MSDPQTLHHLADAIKALRAAWNICDGDKVYEHIVEAESNVFRAIREIANGQVGPDEEPDDLLEADKELALMNAELLKEPSPSSAGAKTTGA